MTSAVYTGLLIRAKLSNVLFTIIYQDIADINSRMEKENSERSAEDQALNDRIDKEIREREEACAQLQNR